MESNKKAKHYWPPYKKFSDYMPVLGVALENRFWSGHGMLPRGTEFKYNDMVT